MPQWDGRATSLENFEEEIELYAAGCEDRQLALLGPRIAQAHPFGSKQRSVAMALSLPALRSADGPQKILKAFKASLTDKAEGEIWTNVQAFVFGAWLQHGRVRGAGGRPA